MEQGIGLIFISTESVGPRHNCGSTLASLKTMIRCTYSCKRSDHLDRHMEKIHNEKRENKGKQNRRLAMENRPINELAIDKSRLSDLEISQSMSEGSQGPESKVFKETSIGRIEIIEESPNNNLCIRMVSKYGIS